MLSHLLSIQFNLHYIFYPFIVPYILKPFRTPSVTLILALDAVPSSTSECSKISQSSRIFIFFFFLPDSSTFCKYKQWHANISNESFVEFCFSREGRDFLKSVFIKYIYSILHLYINHKLKSFSLCSNFRKLIDVLSVLKVIFLQQIQLLKPSESRQLSRTFIFFSLNVWLSWSCLPTRKKDPRLFKPAKWWPFRYYRNLCI